MIPKQEPAAGGLSREVKQAEVVGNPVHINGYLIPNKPDLPQAAMGSSFALTHGVDKDFFEDWMKQNADLELVKNGLIFAHGKAEDIKAQSRDHETLKNGLEPIDKQRLPRGVKSFAKDEV